MTDCLSTVPTFALGDSVWRCWVTDNGQRYEWRSTCGRMRAGRRDGLWRAVVDGREVYGSHESLKAAMQAAHRASERRAA